MKRTIALGVGALLAGLAVFTVSPATADTSAVADDPVTSTAQCSDTPLTMAYYRTWRDVTVPQSANSTLPDPNVIKMTDLPKEVDVAMVFDAGATADTPYWTTLRDTYVPTLHARGTRVVYTLWIEKLANANIPLNETAYRQYAKELVDTYVTKYGLDGLDIDVESSLSGDKLTRAIGVFRALGELIGPKSGTDRIFIYDTNQTGNTPLFEAVSDNISFVLLQAYGRGSAGLQATWETFADDIAPCRFLPGFSFFEEQDRTRWNDAEGLYDPKTAPSSTAYQYATWQPKVGKKGGFFAYAADRDGKVYNDNTITKTDFTWIRNLSAVQDEAAGIPTIDLAVLDETLSTARSLLAGAVVGAQPGQYPAAARAALSDAIARALDKRSSAKTQDEADTAAAELGTAISAFRDAVNPATPVTEARVSLSAPEARVGDTITITASGLTAGERVTAALHSVPLPIGTMTADGSGRATLQWTVPSTAALGAHQVVLTRADGTTVSAAFSVLTASKPTPVPTDPSTPTPAQPDASGHLAATGAVTSATLGAGGAAAVLLAAGLFISAARRRARAH